MECVIVRVRVMDTEKGGYQEIGKCRDVVLEENGKDHLDRKSQK